MSQNNDENDIEDINIGENLIKIHFNHTYLFKKQIELLKNIGNEICIIFYEKSFKIIYQNCNSDLISFFDFNFSKNNNDNKNNKNIKNNKNNNDDEDDEDDDNDDDEDEDDEDNDDNNDDDEDEENDEYYFNKKKIKNNRYIITVDITVLHSILSNFNDGDELNIFIKKHHKDYLFFQNVDENNQEQISRIKLSLNDEATIKHNDLLINQINIKKNLTIIVSSQDFKLNCNKLKKGDKQNIKITFNNKILSLLTYNSSSSSLIKMTNIRIVKNNNITSFSNIYPLDFINYINNALCNAKSLYLSFYKGKNNYCLIIEYVLKNSDEKTYGTVKHILMPKVKN